MFKKINNSHRNPLYSNFCLHLCDVYFPSILRFWLQTNDHYISVVGSIPVYAIPGDLLNFVISSDLTDYYYYYYVKISDIHTENCLSQVTPYYIIRYTFMTYLVCIKHASSREKDSHVCQQYFPNLRKRSATFPFLRLGNHGSDINYRTLPVFSNFWKFLRCVICERDLYCLNFKLNILRRVFTKSNCAITKLVFFFFFFTF